ncbi:hypothetical protein ACGGKE_11990 [Sphingobium naphthae]|uniref:hypothetical protein n=1 Tax=Sphingobium naphthae TaxID=1886786 RepID=UPI002B076918|nr:hypothetical protein [Pseudomonadota bacterium]
MLEILQAVLIDGLAESAAARGDTALVRRLGDGLHRQLLGSGVNMRSIELTDRGFARKPTRER